MGPWNFDKLGGREQHCKVFIVDLRLDISFHRPPIKHWPVYRELYGNEYQQKPNMTHKDHLDPWKTSSIPETKTNTLKNSG